MVTLHYLLADYNFQGNYKENTAYTHFRGHLRYFLQEQFFKHLTHYDNILERDRLYHVNKTNWYAQGKIYPSILQWLHVCSKDKNQVFICIMQGKKKRMHWYQNHLLYLPHQVYYIHSSLWTSGWNLEYIRQHYCNYWILIVSLLIPGPSDVWWFCDNP